MEPRVSSAVFRRSWTLLATNPGIVVPSLVVGVLHAVAQALIVPPLDSSLSPDWLASAASGLTQILATILTIAYTTGMADAAWRTGRARFDDGAHAFQRDGGHVFVAMLALFAIGLAASVLAPFTFGLSILAYGFFCLYSMAAAVVGERPGFLAVAESARIAYRRPLPTLAVVAGIAAVVLVMGFVASALEAAPLVGPLVSDLVVQAVIAYVVLVTVGEYRVLGGVTPA